MFYHRRANTTDAAFVFGCIYIELFLFRLHLFEDHVCASESYATTSIGSVAWQFPIEFPHCITKSKKYSNNGLFDGDDIL
jgi:hypothetical protein